jgi:hypothetical protein
MADVHAVPKVGSRVDAGLILSVIALAVPLVAVVASSILTLRQLRLTTHANLLPVIIQRFQEFRSDEFTTDLDYIKTKLWKDYPPKEWGFDNLPEEARAPFRTVALFFNDVGILVANGVIDDVLATSYMGNSVLRAWNRLEPYIRNERCTRNDKYFFVFFEHLAFVVKQNPPSELNARLKLKAMPASSGLAEAGSTDVRDDM